MLMLAHDPAPASRQSGGSPMKTTLTVLLALATPASARR